jgi:hypothetical protein
LGEAQVDIRNRIQPVEDFRMLNWGMWNRQKIAPAGKNEPLPMAANGIVDLVCAFYKYLRFHWVISQHMA